MIYKELCTIKGQGNREQRIRISIYQKLCIPQYMILDRLKFLGPAHNGENIGNRINIKISTYQKSCIPMYPISDRLKLFILYF